ISTANGCIWNHPNNAVDVIELDAVVDRYADASIVVHRLDAHAAIDEDRPVLKKSPNYRNGVGLGPYIFRSSFPAVLAQNDDIPTFYRFEVRQTRRSASPAILKTEM